MGSYCAEALARAGVGNLTLFDRDVVSESNKNRQLIALNSTLGQPKVEVMKQRIIDITPLCNVTARHMFFLPENAHEVDFTRYDYVVDAVDNVTAKILIISSCKRLGVNVVSCMGTGNKLDPTRFEIADIHNTSVCPLAKIIRKKLREQDIFDVDVLFSKEEPLKLREPASISFVPSVAGLIIAGHVIMKLCSGNEKK